MGIRKKFENIQPFGKKMVHDNRNCKNVLLLNHHLMKNNHLYDVEKLNAKELFFPNFL